METTPTSEQATSQTKKKNKWIIPTVSTICLAAAAVCGFLFVQQMNEQEEARKAIADSPTIHNGITIDGIDVGAMTPEEALAAVLLSRTEGEAELSITLMHEEQEFLIDSSAFGFTYDAEAIVSQAMAFGREGSLEQLQVELMDIQTNGRALTTTATVSHEAVSDAVQTLSLGIDSEPIDASFELLTFEQPLEARKDELPKDMKSAQDIDFLPVEYSEDVAGVTVEQEELSQLLIDMADTNTYENAQIPVTYTEADLTIETIREDFVLRGSYTTSFARSPYNRESRVENLVKATGLINGVHLAPGEEFLTNTVLGDRTYALGWSPAPAIVRGTTEDQAGGGVCQVSSTLYAAVLSSDLEIVYRRGHSEKLSYIAGGLDATIDTGHIDFVWKNNTDSTVYVFSWIDMVNEEINIAIYGEPMEYDYIELTSEKVETVYPSGSTQYYTDMTLAPGQSVEIVERKNGSIWQSYATYYKDGVAIETLPIAKTTYKAYAGEVHVGPTQTQTYYVVGMP